MLFNETKLGKITLKNRIVMAPLTRSRATPEHVPTDIMATYYAQRASAGLLITEGTSPSKNGSGYARMPGIYHSDQIEAWKKVADAVHSRDGRIFMQIMHTGAASHLLNMEPGAKVVAPSSLQFPGQMYTDSQGFQPLSPAHEMTKVEVETAIEEFVTAAKNAVAAGFDGVELHGANGYLIEQFLRKTTNHRRDEYGGETDGRAKFLLEVTKRVGTAIGFDRVGVRLSPYGTAQGLTDYPEMSGDYLYVMNALSQLGIAYLHLLDHSAMGGGSIPADAKAAFRKAFQGNLIAAGNFDEKTAEIELNTEYAQLIAFGRPFISNPDLVEKMKTGKPLTKPDPSTFYTPGAKGYTDYPGQSSFSFQNQG